MQAGKGAAAGLIVSLAFPNGDFEAFGEHAADGRALLDGENACLAEKVCVNLESDVGFHNYQHKFTCITSLRAHTEQSQRGRGERSALIPAE